MLNEAEGGGILGYQRVEVAFQRTAVRATELAEIGNRDNVLRTTGAKESRAGVGTHGIGASAPHVGISWRRIKPDEGQSCSGCLATAFKTAKRWQIRKDNIARATPRETVPRQSPQTIDQRYDPAEDDKVAASHAHKTVTGVPTGTCS